VFVDEKRLHCHFYSYILYFFHRAQKVGHLFRKMHYISTINVWHGWTMNILINSAKPICTSAPQFYSERLTLCMYI
jgi:hypothetical protein